MCNKIQHKWMSASLLTSVMLLSACGAPPQPGDQLAGSSVIENDGVGKTSFNTPPSVQGDSVNSNVNGIVNGQLQAEDADGDSLSWQLVQQPANGTVDLNSTTGAYTYQPNTDYQGSDSFSVQVFDGEAYSAEASVDVAITPVLVDDGGIDPVINPVEPDLTVNHMPVSYSKMLLLDEDMALSDKMDGTDNDDVVLTYIITQQPQHGSLTAFDSVTGQFTYEPNADYNGADYFNYKISDGKDESQIATIDLTILSVNDLPNATADAMSTVQNTLVSTNVLSNDSGLGDQPLQLTINDSPTNGAVQLANNGLVQYEPLNNYHGTDSFSYRITDINGDVSIATVTIQVDCATLCEKTLSLAWDPSATAGVTYKLYVGTSAGTYSEVIDAGTATTADYVATAPGTYYFTVTAVDADSVESVYSNEVAGSF